MEVLWTHGPSAVREVQERFPEDSRPAYTTIQTVMYRLESKKVAQRTRKIGNAHIFEATVGRAAAQRRLISDLLGLFGGEAQPMMAHLIQMVIALVLDHLWQSTLLALGWFAASVKFLVPFAALAAAPAATPRRHGKVMRSAKPLTWPAPMPVLPVAAGAAAA